MQPSGETRRLRVLFVCTHNGARSRMAEEIARLAAPGAIDAHSSGLETGKIGPLPAIVMAEMGVTFDRTPPRSVFERFGDREEFDHIIAICDPDSTEQVDLFIDTVYTLYKRAHHRQIWHIPNFMGLNGATEEGREGGRRIRDMIQSEVLAFLSGLGIDSCLP